MNMVTEKVKPKIVEDWKSVFKSYSFIFHALSIVFAFVEIVLPYMFLIEPMFTPATFGLIMFGLNVAGGIGRFIKQRSVSGKDEGMVS